ncbi:MAG: four helix bundle protein [Candidatus Taylorbacteria bacterium]|nr:four helix bundle protein [Candidatus Taylorbacteria bacterium]
MTDYKQWIVWQKSMDLVTSVYGITGDFPKSELYSLASQMQRAAVSIPSNIAEGYARINPKDKHHFYVISFASSKEPETQLEIARRLKYLDETSFARCSALLLEVVKLLSKMVFRKLE